MQICVHIYKPDKITMEQMAQIMCYLADQGLIKVDEQEDEENFE